MSANIDIWDGDLDAMREGRRVFDPMQALGLRVA